ncbi:MAG: class I SAM-dependent methyltransferase, partial [Lachnospiraceae bacterium]
EGTFYDKQTRDELHLESILKFIDINPGMRILDLGCGTGYLTFPMALRNANVSVVGLDIVANTIIRNAEQAKNQGLSNIQFVSYDGEHFPFEDEAFDLVVTRYALHHFPEIEKSLMEVSRVLKPCGRLFISDPRPNECDTTRFVDDYMQLKKDGHIKFYTKDEWIEICDKCGMKILKSFDSHIHFPKKKATANGFEEVIAKHDKSIIDSYKLEITGDEIWVTEEVNNILFMKQ